MATDRPIPVLRGEERAFFDHAREHRLIYQHCTECSANIFYPRTVCPNCLASDMEPRDAAGTGTIHSFTVLHRPGHPSRTAEVPYTIVLVDLSEGIRILADLVEADPDHVRIGAPVTVVFDDVSHDFTVPRFKLVGLDRTTS